MNCEIHKFRETGGGTGFSRKGQPEASDVSYDCENCPQKLRLYLPPEIYINRKYPKVMLLEIQPLNK